MYKFQIEAANTILLIIDVQDNLITAMKKEIYTNLENNIKVLIKVAQRMDVPILITEQYPKGLGTTSAKIRESMDIQYQPIAKMSFSCWDEPLFQKSLSDRNRKQIIIAGMESHVCVLQTAIDLIENGFYVHVVRDAVCSRFKDDWKTSMEYMQQAGAAVTSTEIVSFQLLQVAGTSEFKSIAPLFKTRK